MYFANMIWLLVLFLFHVQAVNFPQLDDSIFFSTPPSMGPPPIIEKVLMYDPVYQCILYAPNEAHLLPYLPSY